MQELNSIIQQFKERIDNLEDRYTLGDELTIKELNCLGNFKYMNVFKDIHIMDDVFKPFKFREIYLRYHFDLSFKSKYYRRDLERNIIDYLDLEYGLNNDEETFSELSFKKQLDKLIANKIYIPISENEIKKDIFFLRDIALEWAKICSVENHKNRLLYWISIETRKIIRKKIINEFIDAPVAYGDTFKALLKSYHCYNESLVVFEDIDVAKGSIEFKFNEYIVDYDVVSLFHILYRHYAQNISPLSILLSKSYFTPDIPPENIHNFFDFLFEKIKRNRLFENTVISKDDFNIAFKLKGNYYGLAIGSSKDDKNRITVKSFYPIEKTHSEGKKMLTKYQDNAKYQSNYVGDSLFIYTHR